MDYKLSRPNYRLKVSASPNKLAHHYLLRRRPYRRSLKRHTRSLYNNLNDARAHRSIQRRFVLHHHQEVFPQFITVLHLSLPPPALHSPPRHLRRPLGLSETLPMLCVMCHITHLLSTTSSTPDVHIHHPAHSRRATMTLQAH